MAMIGTCTCEPASASIASAAGAIPHGARDHADSWVNNIGRPADPDREDRPASAREAHSQKTEV